MQNDPRYQAARKRARALREFYSNLVSYISVCTMLVVINLMTSGDISWSRWVILFWGIGVGVHGIKLFLPQFDKEWEERKTLELMGEKPKRKNDEGYFTD